MEVEAAGDSTQLQAILDSTPALIVALDGDGKITLINRFALNLLGYAENELLGRDWFDTCLPQPEGREVVYPAFRRIMAGEAAPSEEFENVVLCRDGRRLLIAWRNTTLSDGQGRITGTLSSGVNITGRKQAEEELERFFDLVPDMVCIASTDGYFRKINRAWQATLGYTEQEILAIPFIDFIHPDDREATMQEVARQIAGQATLQFVNRYRCKDGGYKWLEWAATPCVDRKWLYASARDITERKRGEETLKLHKQIIDTALNGFWMVDRNGYLLQANEAYAQMSGYALDELPGMHISRLEAIEQSAEEVAAHSEKIIAQGHDRFETRHRRKDGREINVEVHARFLPETQSFYAFLRDITEPKRAERELRELNEHLEERVERRTRELAQAKLLAEAANRSKSEFLANVSHEIRTPMNSILGMTHLALNFRADRRNQDYLRKIQASGEHLLGIIDDILDFSKLDAGKMKIEMVDFDLYRVLENVRNLVAGKAAAKGLELVFDTGDGLCVNLRGDPLRLAQILVNYADNAIKFTERGRITLRADKVEEDEVSCLVHFEVQDTGPGIGEAELAKLFQPFQQVDASSTRRHEGTGLGLAISKQLAARMQEGEVGVDSVPGQGSTFWFRVRLDKTGLPCCAEDRNVIHVSEKMLATINGARILLVENNLFNQQVATEFLENARATVCVAQNGKEAIDLLANDRFDCVLMDIQMPVLDGFETTRLIRANPALAKIPVIAMTANVSDEYRRRCLVAGMNGFIGKPFMPDAFYAAIIGCLAGRMPRVPAPGKPLMHATVDKAAWPGDPDVIDFAALAELMGGDKRKMREFAFKFLASARQDMAAVEAALERGDMAALGVLGHHIGAPARMAGAKKFAGLCRALEGYAKGDADIAQIRENISQMRALLERIDEQISREFA